MSFDIRYTPAARADIMRLYEFLLEKDLALAERALEAITRTIEHFQEKWIPVFCPEMRENKETERFCDSKKS